LLRCCWSETLLWLKSWLLGNSLLWLKSWLLWSSLLWLKSWLLWSSALWYGWLRTRTNYTCLLLRSCRKVTRLKVCEAWLFSTLLRLWTRTSDNSFADWLAWSLDWSWFWFSKDWFSVEFWFGIDGWRSNNNAFNYRFETSFRFCSICNLTKLTRCIVVTVFSFDFPSCVPGFDFVGSISTFIAICIATIWVSFLDLT